MSNLKQERIGNPGLAKLEARAAVMSFPPQLWFGGGTEDRAPDTALVAALKDETVHEILEVTMRLGSRERRLLLGIARQISSPIT